MTPNRTQLLLFPIGLLTFYLAALNINAEELTEKQKLGQQLFFDVNLSKNRTQSCASCHNPANAFIDSRPNISNGAASVGDDGKSLGDRNTPSAAYANQIPSFHTHNDGHLVGGLFWDGRANSLEEQAAGPPLNPLEMAMPDKHAVVDRLIENDVYLEQFPALFGADVFDDPDSTFVAMTSAIAAFERSAMFSPFDSKYDRYLKGEYQMTEEEDLGMTLFFSEQFTNCNQCHQLKRARAENETFSNYEYHNIGTPVNDALRAINGKNSKDLGLGALIKPEQNKHAGKFRVPSLRNVAVTSPYMHNGVFSELETVVKFYNKFNSQKKANQINPETEAPWRLPEVDNTISLKELQSGPALDQRRIRALVAFMRTLTDQRYEHLLESY